MCSKILLLGQTARQLISLTNPTNGHFRKPKFHYPSRQTDRHSKKAIKSNQTKLIKQTILSKGFKDYQLPVSSVQNQRPNKTRESLYRKR